MKALPLFVVLFVLLTILAGCKDEEDNNSVVGTWNVVTHGVEQVRGDEVIFEATYFETGIYQFNSDGTGFVLLDVPVIGLPTDQDIFWEEDSVGRITIDYNDGSSVHRFDPSYRGEILLLQGSQFSGTIGNFLITNSEILYRKN
ncbi:MAG: hypothetical protein RIF33_17350 [Cyclobacteriaceae bacterium]